MIGRTLAHYSILEQIGKGGMGAVYRARDTRLDRDVALKILPGESARKPGWIQRFEREAKAVAALKHPNIVTIHSIENSQGIHFITLELITGKTLGGVISDSGVSEHEFLDIARPLVDAVRCAHATGITHRDLKPANIMLDPNQGVKILDFGLAKQWDPEPAQTDDTISSVDPLTQTGAILGTPAYMAPEQISGGKIDGKTDTFSLGIIFYELLAGSRPFRGTTQTAIMYSIVNEDPPPLPSSSTTLQHIVHRCLEKKPEDRYTAEELCRALHEMSTVAPGHSSAMGPKVQAALDNEDWQQVIDLLQAKNMGRDLSAQELASMAKSLILLSRFDEGIQTYEKAYAAYLDSEETPKAAEVALLLYHNYEQKLAGAVAGVWFRRTEQLLEHEPECIEHGKLHRKKVARALASGDLDSAEEHNQACSRIAGTFEDTELQTVALHDRGQILIARGKVEQGKQLIDEAMTTAVGGAVTSGTLGDLYCRTLSVCKALADYNRAREWTAVAFGWCKSYSMSSYMGICRVYSAETQRHQGQWGEAREMVQLACDDFKKHGFTNHEGEALNELGELALQQGDYQGAESAFTMAHELGYDPVPGLPLLRLAQGKPEAASKMINRALAETPDNHLRRAQLLVGAIPIASMNQERDMESKAVDELESIADDYNCQTYKAHALLGRASLRLSLNDPTTAAQTAREAWTLFKDLGFVYDAARVRVLLAQAYMASDHEDDARLQLEAAQKTFKKLGASPSLASTAELMKRLN